ncbi:MAG: AAA family ATPase [Frankiales bacterium]|nr:AAA family ATPase [Frankiales bacterium]
MMATNDAGRSALEQAALSDELADAVEWQLRTLTEILGDLRRRSASFRAGAQGERAVADRVEQVLVDLGSTDWHVLADRRWPGSRHANLDLLLVGPPGVLVLDSKKWAHPRIERGSLWNGDANEDDQLDSLRDQAEAVAHALTGTGLSAAAVEPFLVLAGRLLAPVLVRGVHVVGERSIHRSLIRLPVRLGTDEIAAVVTALEKTCPPASRGATPDRRTISGPAVRREVPSHGGDRPGGEPLALLDEGDVWQELIAAAEREPIESWMTWLHPLQAQLVTRPYNGPARIRGAAGTGKTVVALHRARLLARRPGSRVLVTSFVRTLPQVHRGLFARLAPAEAARVEFVGVHAWATRLLRGRGAMPAEIAPNGGRGCFREVWTRSADRAALLSVVDSEDYWWDEIHAVIKGRGLRSEAEYLALTRVGRRTPLQEPTRRQVWTLYQRYQQALAERGLIDFADVIDAALASVRAEPIDPAYTSVIVDEVQDLTCQGLRLLHALVGDADDGLLLVGDGQQAVYPGGFTLREAGVYVPGGRAAVLSMNYRNGAEILSRSLQLLSSDAFDDLDAVPEPGAREVEVARPGGRVLEVRADDEQSLVAALHSALGWAGREHRRGDMAVLVRSNVQARRWRDLLYGLGVPSVLLSDYDGVTVDAVKVGTYQRAKGLEFAAVFLPDHDAAVEPQRAGESDATYAERAELQRRQLFVAMTRARDRLWLGTRTRSAPRDDRPDEESVLSAQF